MGRFKDGLRCKGWVNSVIINVITEMNYFTKLRDYFLHAKKTKSITFFNNLSPPSAILVSIH